MHDADAGEGSLEAQSVDSAAAGRAVPVAASAHSSAGAGANANADADDDADTIDDVGAGDASVRVDAALSMSPMERPSGRMHEPVKICLLDRSV